MNSNEVISKQYIAVNGKQYFVLVRAGGTIDISTTWESVHPADAGSVFPRKIHRHAFVSQYSRLGKKIVSMLAPL